MCSILSCSPFRFWSLYPACRAATPRRGPTPTPPRWSPTSCWAPSGTRGTPPPPVSVARARGWPWCPCVPRGPGARRHATARSPLETSCWTWRRGTSPTSWSRLTPPSSEPGGLRWHRYLAGWKHSKLVRKKDKPYCPKGNLSWTLIPYLLFESKKKHIAYIQYIHRLSPIHMHTHTHSTYSTCTDCHQKTYNS